MKKNRKKFIWIGIVFLAIVILIYGIFRLMQPDIKIDTSKVSITIYDNDVMNSDRIQLLSGEYYTNVDAYKELCITAADENEDYGTSFVVIIPCKITRKSKDNDYQIYFNITYSDEAEEYIYVKALTLFDGFDKDVLYMNKKTIKRNVCLFGCTKDIDDDKLIELINSIRVTVTIKDNNGAEETRELDINTDNLEISHESLDTERDSPFYVDEDF